MEPLPFSEILKIVQQGNIVLSLLETVRAYPRLGFIQDRVFELIKNSLSLFPWLMSREVIAALKTLPQTDSDYHGLSAILENFSTPAAPSIKGRSVFPVESSFGLVREIMITDYRCEDFTKKGMDTLVMVGDQVVAYIRKKLERQPLLWRPENWGFKILSLGDRLDNKVDGKSLDLALALAFFSALTGRPVPSEIAATAELLPNGKLAPVEPSCLSIKLNALERERHYIKEIYIASEQTGEGLADTRLCPKTFETLSQALDACFPGPITIPAMTIPDMSLELATLKSQYNKGLYSTCIGNAKAIINYLSTGRCNKSHSAVTTLFECNWRLASCYCHQGKVKQTRNALKYAEKIYNKYSDIIEEKDWAGFRITVAVALKDYFQYEEANALHMKIMEDCGKTTGVVPHVRGKNLSAFSQLCLATGHLDEALRLQNEALRLINPEESSRNYYERALILTRSGKFKEAMTDFKMAKARIENLPPDKKPHTLAYFNWYLAEYNYRKYLASTHRDRTSILRKIESIAGKIETVSSYPQAMVFKFAGIVELETGKVQYEEIAMARFNKALLFLELENSPVFLLMAASIRAHRAIHFLHRSFKEQTIEDVSIIIAHLSAQQDFKTYFSKQLKSLSQFLKTKNQPVETELKSIIEKIPY